MKKHVPYLLSLLSIMVLLAWTASVNAQCLTQNVTLDVPIDNGAANDLSDFAHTVSVQGGAAYVAGQNGNSNGALQFSNQNQYAQIDADPSFEQMSDGFTIAAWINPSSFLQYNCIVSKLNASHRNINFRYHNDGRLHIHFTNQNNGITGVTTDDPVISTGQWTHVAATWDGTTMKLFVDGELEKEMVLTQTPNFQSAGPVRIGYLTGSERLVGYVDDVQLRSFPVADADMPCLMNHSITVEDEMVLDLPLDGDATDQSTYGNNGTISGAAVAANRFMTESEALSFSGSGSVSITNQAQYGVLASAFTISAWIKPSVVGGNRVILSKVGSGRDIVLRVDNGKFTVHYYVSGYVWFVPATATVQADEWTHVACTWDGTVMTLYQNREEVFSSQPATTPNFTSNEWTVGALTSSGNEGFSGEIDDIKVWSRALSPCELSEIEYPVVDLVAENNLLLCPGQTQTVQIADDLCSVLWTNENSIESSFEISAADLGVGDHQIVVEAYNHYDNFYSDTVNVTVALCTGMNEVDEEKSISIYPNPATDFVTISGNELSVVELLDVTGRLTFSQALNRITRHVLDVSSYPSGTYIIRSSMADGKVETKRLIKQ